MNQYDYYRMNSGTEFRNPYAVRNGYEPVYPVDAPYSASPLSEGKEKESVFRSVVLFRILPVLLILLSLNCLFAGWIRFSDDLRTDLNEITGYVGTASSLLEKFAGITSIGGIETSELEAVIDMLSDGKLTPYEICTEVDTVEKASMELSQLCDRLDIQSNSVEMLDTMADAMAVFRILCYILLGTAVLTILLILFRIKILGNWFFTAAMAALPAWCLMVMHTVNERIGSEYHVGLTIVPLIAVILSLPLIPYRRKKQ